MFTAKGNSGPLILEESKVKIDPVTQSQIDMIDSLDIPTEIRGNLKNALIGLHDVRSFIMSKRIAGEQGEERRSEALLIQRIYAAIFGDNASKGSSFIPSASGLGGIITERINEIGHFVYQNLSKSDIKLPACFEYTARDFNEIQSVVAQIIGEERFAVLLDRADTVRAMPWGYKIDFKKPLVSDFEKDMDLFSAVETVNKMNGSGTAPARR